MGKSENKSSAPLLRYILNIPEIDYIILDALLSSPISRIGTKDLRDYYRKNGLRAPTSSAFSQALARLKQRGILNVERHEYLWIEFSSEEIGKSLFNAFEACRDVELKIKRSRAPDLHRATSG